MVVWEVHNEAELEESCHSCDETADRNVITTNIGVLNSKTSGKQLLTAFDPFLRYRYVHDF